MSTESVELAEIVRRAHARHIAEHRPNTVNGEKWRSGVHLAHCDDCNTDTIHDVWKDKRGIDHKQCRTCKKTTDYK